MEEVDLIIGKQLSREIENYFEKYWKDYHQYLADKKIQKQYIEEDE